MSFVLKDVINRVSKTRQSMTGLLFDMTDLVKYLSEKKSISLSNTSITRGSLFFTMKRSNHLWELCQGKSISLYDTKHG